MIITRRIGVLLRGKATPFHLYVASVLGCLLGFLPGFDQAPVLILFWGFLLLILNANLFLAGLITLLAKLIFLLTMPALFQIGRLLLEGPTQGFFKALINAPVTAYAGFDYYVVPGGQLVAVIVGLVIGTLLSRALYNYRRRMAEFSEHSERLKSYSSKGWVKAMKFVFLGGDKGGKSYRELMEVKMGNPIRIWGVAVVLVCVAVMALGFRWLAGPVLTNLAKTNLEAMNGATVDLERVDLRLQDSKLEISGFAMADPEDLGSNLLESKRVIADVSAADLLRKRFSVDHLVFEDAATGLARETPGELVGPAPKVKKKTPLPGFEDLEAVLKDAEIWKKRLAQARQWLERLTASKDPDAKPSWEEELNSRIQSVGHAHVKAAHLTEGSPALWIHRFEALGVRTPYFDGSKVDIVGTDLSTHPGLVPEPPIVTVKAHNERFDARLALGGASGTGSNDLSVKLREYPVEQFASQLKSSGEPPLKGGTMDVDLSGQIGALNNDLVAQVAFDGTTARIAGEPVNLDGVTLPLNIRGPLDRPGVKLESKALERVLVSAGKTKLLDRAAEELGVEGEEGSEPANVLKDLLKKRLEKK